MSEDIHPVPLRISNKVAYVWDVEDVATLRSKHRICGTLTGTLPHLSQQNVFLGLPLILMPEEVVLLVDNKVAVLVDDPTSHHPPTPEQLSTWNANRVSNIQQQVTRSKLEADHAMREKTGCSMSETAMQKRKEREEKKRLKELAKAAEEANGKEESTAQPTPDVNEKTASAEVYTVTIAAESTSLPWYSPDSTTIHTTLESASAASIWKYPSTLQERAKCGVFRDLWKQNYFLGGGIKFGGDWLVYPGDPLRYHSHFVATAIESPLSTLKPMEIVAHGRLGTATKKAHLLCGWDDEKKSVSYFSIEWAGFG